MAAIKRLLCSLPCKSIGGCVGVCVGVLIRSVFIYVYVPCFRLQKLCVCVCVCVCVCICVEGHGALCMYITFHCTWDLCTHSMASIYWIYPVPPLTPPCSRLQPAVSEQHALYEAKRMQLRGQVQRSQVRDWRGRVCQEQLLLALHHCLCQYSG